jgi:hypothetical protein
MENAQWQRQFHRVGSLSRRLEVGPDIYQLMTLRDDGQFNTTIYNENDRFVA